MIAFAREKRLILGCLGLLAPLPLPFNSAVSVPGLVVYWLALLVMLYRALERQEPWVPNWLANVLAIAYLPILYLDLSSFIGGRLVRPLMHLALYAVAVKLFALHSERDKWHAFAGIFFVFLGAMGTSVHPSISLYLVGFVVMTLFMLFRFAFFHSVGSYSVEEARRVRVPVRALLSTTTVVVVAAAIPLFALLPRVGSPYIVGRSLGGEGNLGMAGFSDEMSLDDIGQIRGNRAVALRIAYANAEPDTHTMRFKAATYDVYEGLSWRKNRHTLQIRGKNIGAAGAVGGSPVRGSRFRISDVEATSEATIWLQPIGTSGLVMPVETVEVEANGFYLGVDVGGALDLLKVPRTTEEYRVFLSDEPGSAARIPGADDGRRAAADRALDRSGVTRAIEDLAAEVGGGGTDVERARRIERFFVESFEYTLELVGRVDGDPLEDFLFRYRRGHCELFASAMVLMLRAENVPARLVTGFLGAEYNPLETYYTVRQDNAHAWVEAFVDGRWVTFDPTPPLGRPAARAPSFSLLMAQAYDYVTFRWDRYVLTYGMQDQFRMFAGALGRWSQFWSRFQQEPAPAVAEEDPVPSPGAPATVAAPSGWNVGVLLWLLPAGLMSWLLVVLVRRQRDGAGTAAYRRLRRLAARAGFRVEPSVGPLALCYQLADARPAAEELAGKVVGIYLREAFDGEPASPEDARRLQGWLRELRLALKT